MGYREKNTWSEVTSNQYLQNQLQRLYPNGPDVAESIVGALSEIQRVADLVTTNIIVK